MASNRRIDNTTVVAIVALVIIAMLAALYFLGPGRTNVSTENPSRASTNRTADIDTSTGRAIR